MPSNENVSLRGVIVRALPNTTWMVKIPGDQEIVAYLSGKLRINNIRLEPGDEVEIHLSPYSLEKGRIVYRY